MLDRLNITDAVALRNWCAGRHTCDDALDWLGALPADTPLRGVYDACPRGEWLLWALQEAGIDIAPIMPAVFAAVDRAVRQYAPTALRHAGYTEQAARMESRPEIVDSETASAARAAWNKELDHA